jgi:prepilin-type N-terminal cleavage/methylation domain-containing protein
MLKRGFTLIELLVALGLLSIVLLFLFDTFTHQHQTYTVVDQVAEAQQNSRAIARLMERDIRNAGYLVPVEASACGVDNTNAPDLLFVSDTDAVLPADELPVEFAGDELAATASNQPTALSGSPLAILVDDVVIDGTPSYDTDGDGTADSDFAEGGGAILVDVDNPGRGVACGLVTTVTTAAPQSVSVLFMALHDVTVPASQDLKLVPAHVYRIVPGSDPPRLERDGVVLAKDVEDFQVAYFYDDDGNGEVDDPGETRGDANTALDTDDVDGNDLREIRLNLVVRTRADDPRNPGSAGTGQARENRTASIPGDDGKHRRVHTATVRLRNLTL